MNPYFGRQCIFRERRSTLEPASSDPLIQQRFSFAHEVILKAGAVADSYFSRLGSLTIKSKGAHDLVSEADVETETLIRQAIAQHFPADAFLGEESGFAAAGPEGGTGLDGGAWVVDPIDGTQPFLSGLPGWCVSIAFVHHGALQFGLVYNPPCRELFSGGKGFPARVNDTPLAASPATDFSSGLVSIGFSARTPHGFLFSSLTKLLAADGMFFRSGSGALSLAYVGAGRLLGHVEPHMHAWDCLGAMAIIEAAGGRVNDYLVGGALLSGNKVIAGAPALYDQLATLLDYE